MQIYDVVVGVENSNDKFYFFFVMFYKKIYKEHILAKQNLS